MGSPVPVHLFEFTVAPTAFGSSTSTSRPRPSMRLRRQRVVGSVASAFGPQYAVVMTDPSGSVSLVFRPSASKTKLVVPELVVGSLPLRYGLDCFQTRPTPSKVMSTYTVP